MLNFAYNQLILYLSIIIVLFVPGYFLLRAIFSNSKKLSTLENFIISFGASLIIIDFLMIIMGKIHIPLTRFSILTAIAGFVFLCLVIKKFHNTFWRPPKSVMENKETNNWNTADKLFNFSKNQTILILLILFLTIFIKTAYLKDSIISTATDLGHHMFWTEQIVETGKLPVYQANSIVTVDGNYEISAPQKIADFIIGEHLPFTAIALFSGANVISSFPILVLMFIDILSILAVFILALRLFEDYRFGKNAAILALLLIGPIYAISSPQEKFVSGGVIGNIIGNFLLPLVIYFFYRALKEKNKIFMTLAVIFTFGLAYTHHLTTFVFIFAFLFSLILFVIFNYRNLSDYGREWKKIIFSKSVFTTLIAFSLFFVLVYAPSYAQKNAVDTAVGTPTKTTRTGLTFTQLSFTGGEARMALGIFALLVLLAFHDRKKYSSIFLLGWGLALFVMALEPGFLFVNIPSDRIANYITYPLALLSAFALGWIFSMNGEKNKNYLNSKLFASFFVILFTFTAFSGFFDNAQSAQSNNNATQALETFAASTYLAQKVNASDIILKDHIYITADSWIKIFFMRGYNYPLSRGYLKRYDDPTKPREQCTLWMISTPNSPDAQKCYAGTKTNFVMVNPHYDSAQFEKLTDFWKVYVNNDVAVFYKK